MSLSAGSRLLNGRYRLIGSEISKVGDGELWGAIDEEEVGKPLLLKAWAFPNGPDGSPRHRPDDVQRALWDGELRTLYRVRSTPGSEDSLLQLRDVGIDYDERYFVMVFETAGLQTLAALLGSRGDHDWLNGRTEERVGLWQMLARFTDGLGLLHDQQVVHRNVVPESVLLDADEGPASARLGGFEWSIRLGRPAAARAGGGTVGWETTPEALDGLGAFGPDADWFAFGMLAARCILPIEHLDAPGASAESRYRGVLKQLERPKARLTALEAEFIRQLIAEDPTVRLSHHSDISATIRDIIVTLRDPERGDGPSRPHIVIINPANRNLVDDCLDRGLGEMLGFEPGDTFDPQRLEHRIRLHDFLYQDFADGATVTPTRGRDQYLLSGRSMHLMIQPSTNDIDGKKTWQNAFCCGSAEHLTADPMIQTTVPPGRLEFFSTRDKRSQGDRLAGSARWEELLPEIDKGRQRRDEHERFLDFLRFTNQVDLLIRDADLFRCQITDVKELDGACVGVEVQETDREHPAFRKFRMEGGMAEFLVREKHSGKPGSNLIHLGPPSSESMEMQIVPGESDPEWMVDDVDIPNGTAWLIPHQEPAKIPKVGDVHVLRTSGLRGQVSLIRRRKDAIAKLATHSYLLDSLTAPGQVLMNSEIARLPVPLDKDTVDKSKLTQIKTILGARPIYTVQGPPGTGKTHMVSWLLREILEEDPVAQVLITAQAHHAVDVLRSKVDRIFEAVPERRRPLAIRLRSTSRGRKDIPHVAPENGSEQQVTLDLLMQAIERIEALGVPAAASVQADWLEACHTMVADLVSQNAEIAKEFRELVKRSASITYSTTNDGDLAALGSDVSYDWAIVEEAGKVHGFELALPMFLGHRWLLIGDPKQLPPYRIEDYDKAIAEVASTVQALEQLQLPNKNVDRDFIRGWRDRTEQQQQDFQRYCTSWLRLFERLHKLTAHHEPEGGLLTGQHRMHPTIGELVSEVYYDGQLEHFTQDAATLAPKPHILHNLVSPDEIQGRAVVWLDLPANDLRTREIATPKYRSEAEAHALDRFLRTLHFGNPEPLELAVLSPYAQQVAYLRQRLGTPEFQDVLLERGLVLAANPQKSPTDGEKRMQDGFFTVDSFQGNQAEVIAISLVRNNQKQPPDGLGFLSHPQRMNVLISRAERLLILVGSWEFFRAQVAHVSRNPDRFSSLLHLALMTDRLESWFAEGKAVRVSADLTDFRAGTAQPRQQRAMLGGVR
jgi:serine/threonine protein kinase